MKYIWRKSQLMYSLGYDIGSSSVKVSLVHADSGEVVDLVHSPENEMSISAEHSGWAEQHPDLWWKNVCLGTQNIIKKNNLDPKEIKSIGIAYQMHGLVLVDRQLKVLRPSIIWCDSRSVQIGERALSDLGQEYCFDRLLNSPGNFTASKLRWVKENEPDVFERVYKLMLPGDFIAMKLTGEINTTVPGLSEGILWDFKKNKIANRLLDYYGIGEDMIPDIVNTFEIQGTVHQEASEALGIAVGTPVTYRAGDQPNNALSLRVFNPGEIAATGGTSGVVYGVSDSVRSDRKSRVNAFAHVNHRIDNVRIGQLLCINGAGSQYAWIKNQIGSNIQSYTEMEAKIAEIPVGSDGLRVLPFGNGTERMLNNIQTGAHFSNVQFNIHKREHFYRAALEGIAFSFVYGIRAMEDLGIRPETIRVGNDNLFQSRTFAMTICNLLGCSIEMMNTTGAVGAARASRIGIGECSSPEEAIDASQVVKKYSPDDSSRKYHQAFTNWERTLVKILNQATENNIE